MFLMDAETLSARSRKLTEDAAIAFANRDYTPEDTMRLLLEALQLQTDTLAALRRYTERRL